MNRIVVAAVVLVATGAGALGYIGYLGGEVFSLVSAQAGSDVAAVFISSDMGMRTGIGPQIVRRLAADGLPVVAVNALTYFRFERTPAQAERLLESAIERALALPGTRRLVLVGQSFGADILQASLARLPDALRHRIALVVLIVPPDTTLYRASPAEIFGFGEQGPPATATARRLDWVPVLCIHGAEEPHSLCPELTMPNVETVALPGGHLLNSDADSVYAAIAPQLRRLAPEHYR